MSEVKKLLGRLADMDEMFSELDKHEMALTCKFAAETIQDHLKAIEGYERKLDAFGIVIRDKQKAIEELQAEVERLNEVIAAFSRVTAK